jgi:hypothetical protein
MKKTCRREFPLRTEPSVLSDVLKRMKNSGWTPISTEYIIAFNFEREDPGPTVQTGINFLPTPKLPAPGTIKPVPVAGETTKTEAKTTGGMTDHQIACMQKGGSGW